MSNMIINRLIGVAKGELAMGKKGAPIQAGVVHWNTSDKKSHYNNALYGNDGYWCATFVSWCAQQAGIPPSIIPKHRLTTDGANWFKSKGLWGSSYAAAQRGDIIYYKIGTRGGYVNHVGIMESRNDKGEIVSIDGNTSSKEYPGSQDTGGCVAVKPRPKNGGAVFVGFGRPTYTSPAITVPPWAIWDTAPQGPVNILLATDGYWGPLTTRALQKRFGTVIDGVISGQIKGAHNAALQCAQWGTGGSRLVIAMQKWLGITADGNIGPQTIRSLQTRMGTSVDGVISSPSRMVAVMQRRLNAGTL